MFNMTVIVAALGYFVDIYDLTLFGIVRRPSLAALGFADPQLTDTGIFLFNMQMAGMLLGGILWGLWGDRKGRISVLFGSIVLYSIANICNGFVQTIPQYVVLRFIAGLGLAGELGAGITLVNETMTREHRGYGTMLVVMFGALGAVAGSLIADNFSWNVSYFVGGGLGFALLILRIGTFESGMFKKVEKKATMSLIKLFGNRERFYKYICSILIGVPVWYVVGILVFYAPEFSTQVIHVQGNVTAGTAILWSYVGLSAGDLLSGLLSQIFRSRKKIIVLYLFSCTAITALYLFSRNISVTEFYLLTFVLGFATGYWALFVTMASEQFGTNIRSTVTNTVPNFVRGSVIPVTWGFKELAGSDYTHLLNSACIIGAACLAIAFLSVIPLKDTFGKDLDYTEIS